jgi:hypothetical protein
VLSLTESPSNAVTYAGDMIRIFPSLARPGKLSFLLTPSSPVRVSQNNEAVFRNGESFGIE